MVGLRADEAPTAVLATVSLLVVGGVWGVFWAYWTPHRVIVVDTGVVLQASAREVCIPWDDLESVGTPWWDTKHQSLRWRRRRGRPVTTLQAFPELHRPLVEIEERSPGTSVWS
ncbi:MAG TPA: hypothetical protein VIL48_06550 [Acidimicrobiales bacterium]